MNPSNPNPEPVAEPDRLVVDDCWNRIGVFGNKSCKELPIHIRCLNCETFHGAAARLLDRRAPEGYRESWTERVAHARAPKLAGTRSIVIFRVGAEWLALPTACFLEVAQLRPIHSLPHRSGALVRGLTVIRGELVTCISLAHLLGVNVANAPEAEPVKAAKGRNAYERLLVVGREGERVVFAVDEVHSGVRYHPNDLKPIPSTVSQSTYSYTQGLLEWEGHSVGVLDDSLLFYTLGRQLA
ncbi:MAG: chemotaxis protein CheW [Chthoniobacteraceae bacterium]